MAKVWIHHADYNVGGGGATIKVYSTAEIAIQNNPGNWMRRSPSFYELVGTNYYEPESIYEAEVDSNEEMTSAFQDSLGK